MDSKERFCEIEKVMWLHHDLKFSVNEFMAGSSGNYAAMDQESAKAVVKERYLQALERAQ